jgi:hypothetical protein
MCKVTAKTFHPNLSQTKYVFSFSTWTKIDLDKKQQKNVLGDELFGLREHLTRNPVTDYLVRPHQGRTPPPMKPDGANGSSESLYEELEAAAQKRKEDLFWPWENPNPNGYKHLT